MLELKKSNILLSLVILYVTSLTISKFGISFFGGIIALISIYLFFIYREKNKESYIVMFLFLLGVILQFFSLGQGKSSLVFFYKNYFLLISIFIFYFFNQKNNIYKLISKAFEVGLFIGILKSFYIFYKIYDLKYTSSIRVYSFFDIGRWGIILVMGLLLILPNLKKKNYFSWIVFILGIISLILNNSRGPILSFILGIFVYIILEMKIRKILSITFIFILLGGLIYFKPFSFLRESSDRMTSISETHTGGNAARLFMWKENTKFMIENFKSEKRIFYFGTGIKNREKPFKEYIERKYKPEDIKKYLSWGLSFQDAHNAYLNMFVQTGIIYTIIYYLTILIFTFKIFINYLYTKNKDTLSYLSAVIAFYFCGIFYGYSFTYETFMFFFILTLGLIKRMGENNDINIRS